MQPKSKSYFLRIKNGLWSIVHKKNLSKSLESAENYFKDSTNHETLRNQNQSKSELNPKYYSTDQDLKFVDKTKKFLKQFKVLILGFILFVTIAVFSILFRS